MTEYQTIASAGEPAFYRNWTIRLLFSLCMIAALGALMRYKMGFTFPYLDQKNLQHAHSHFAFAGWVTQSLMLLLLWCIRDSLTEAARKLAGHILMMNWLLAWGMLAAFAVQGYGTVSIVISTCSLPACIFFAVFFLRRLPQRGAAARPWFIAAVLFGALSLAGTVKLTVMMATRHIPQHDYLASVYWYLHFQYNGWFFFASMGVLMHYMQHSYQVVMPGGIFWLLSLSCVPAYGLSVLWAHPPLWMYIIITAAAAAQLLGWLWFLRRLMAAAGPLRHGLERVSLVLLVFVMAAGTVKFLLQAGSVHPEMSKLAFGFRPIVIAYLHLALLAFISMFIVFHFTALRFVQAHTGVRAGVYMILPGIFLNEAVLGVQGVASFSYTVIRNTEYYLFGTAVWILAGAAVLFYAALRRGNGI